MPFNEHRYILALSDDDLEDLVKKWIARLCREGNTYVGFERPTGSADMGRDAVGFLTDRRYEGAWHNYQCKHLKRSLGTKEFLVELGKVFHYACEGEFALPERYIFVAPKGAVRDVARAVGLPSTISSMLIDGWDDHCLRGISSRPVPLTSTIREAINAYDFANVGILKATELVEDRDMRALLTEALDLDPGIAPTIAASDVPAAVGVLERPLVAQLAKVFGEHRGADFADHADLVADRVYGSRLTNERRSYLEHQAFRRHFRDNLPERDVDAVDDDIRDGVGHRYHAMTGKPLHDRFTEVMADAAKVDVSGPLGRHRRVTVRVKQGACHHFAVEGEMPWA